MPPQTLTLRSRPWQDVLLLLVSLVLMAGGLSILEREGPSLMAWFCILFFGLCSLVFAVQIHPASTWLRLEREGFTVCSLFRQHKTLWKDVRGFYAGRLGPSKTVLYALERPTQAAHFAEEVGGAQAALPQTYGVSAAKLADLMNAWKARGEA